MKNGSQKPKNSLLPVYRIELGREGEELALGFLQSHGFTLVARNWRCRMGEIDLIVSKGQEIRFIEVKMRKSHAFGYPESSVTRKKLFHLQSAMELWLRQQPKIPKIYQLDVLAISLLQTGQPPQIEWIQGV